MNNYLRLLFLTAGFLLFDLTSQAASYTWSGGAGTTNWNTDANWTTSPGTGHPVNGDNVTIIKSGSPITISIPSTVTTLVNFTTSNITLTFNSNISLTGTVSFTSTVFSPTGTLSVSTSSTLSVTSSTFGIDLTIVSTNATGSAVSISSTTFNQKFDLTAYYFSLISDTFNSTTTILKNGSLHMNNATLCHDNTFAGTTNVSHEGSGALYFPNDNDQFNGVTVFEQKASAAFWYLCNTSSTSSPVYFRNNCEFINNSTDQFTLANQTTDKVYFSALTGLDSIEVKFTHKSSGYYHVGNLGSVNFLKAKVHVISTYAPGPSLPYGGYMQFGAGLSSPTGNKVTFDPKSNLYTTGLTAAFGMTSTIFQGQYTAGVTEVPDTLRFLGNFYQLGWGLNNVFDRHVKMNVLNLTGLSGTFRGVAVIIQSTKDGLLGGASSGGLDFYNDVTFIHTYPLSNGNWFMFGPSVGSSVYATFNSTPAHRSVVTLISASPSFMWFGYLSGKMNVNDVDFIIDRQVGNAFIVGYVMDVSFINTKIYIKQNINTSLTFGNTGRTIFDGAELDLTECTNGNIVFDNFLSKENLSMECITGAANSTNFIFNPNATFNKALVLKAPNFAISGGLYKGNTEFYKYQTTGTIDKLFGAAAAIFESDLTLINGSSKNVTFGLSGTDSYTFKGNVTVKRLSTGETRFARAGICNFQGNLDHQGDFSSFPWGDGGGSCVFNGTGNQTITHNSISTYPLFINKLEVNKTSGKLTISNNVRVQKYGGATGVLTLRKGNIVTQLNSLSPQYSTLNLGDDATVTGGGKHSYIEGPLSKEGNDAFKFFIGKGTKYFPLSITAPSTTGAQFTAEFTDSNQPNGKSLTGTLKDAINCQYWKLDKTAGTSTGVDVTLFWNNDLSQCCYPINHDIVCVARFNSTNWVNEGNNVLNDYQPADSGYVKSSTTMTSWGYFSLGYRNALVLNTYLTNPTKFKVYNNVEKMNLVYTSGASGSAAGDKTMLSDAKNVAGNIVVHPSFSSTVDLNIDQQLSGTPTDLKASYINYIPLYAKIYTTAAGSANVVDHVTIDEDGDNTFLALLSDVHQISGNTLNFYKEKQSPTVFELTNNLTDALTYTVNRYITTPYTSFQITSGVPSGYTATLNVYKIDNTLIATNNTDLKWNGKVDATTFYAEGLYRYEVVLTNGTTTKTYNGQLILKHQ